MAATRASTLSTRSRHVQLVVLLVGAMLATACSSSAPGFTLEAPPSSIAPSEAVTVSSTAAPTRQGEAQLPAVSDLETQSTDDVVRVSWQVGQDAVGYELDVGGATAWVAIEACDNTCTVDIDPTRLGSDATITIVAVGEAGQTWSDPTEQAVSTEPKALEPPAEPDQILIMRPNGTAERVPLEPNADIESAIETAAAAARAEGPIASIGLNHNGFAHLQDEPEPTELPPGSALGNWHESAMDFDEIPGEPPGEGIVVAVIDTGIDANHPALAGRVLDGTSIANPGDSGTDHPGTHGTTVASVIVGNPDSPVRGIAPGASILPVDVYGDDDSFDEGRLAEAIIWAVDNGADVINISLSVQCNNIGSVEFSCPTALRPAIDHAAAAGIPVVVSAGNNGDGADWCDGGTTNPLDFQSNARQWPAVYDEVISVGGSNSNGEQWVCSPDRPDVDVLAPAAGLLVALPGGGYGFASGTSYSSPLIAGLIATLLAADPDLEVDEIFELISQATTPEGVIDVHMLLRITILGDFSGPEFNPGLDVLLSVSVDLTFSDTHPVSASFNAHPTYPPLRFPGFSTMRGTTGDNSAFGTIAGSIFVRPDGTIEGQGQVIEISPRLKSGLSFSETGGGPSTTVSRDIKGYSVQCPYSYMFELPPAIAFYWDVPVHITGEAVDDGRGGYRYEMTFSLGSDATSDEAGDLPPVVISHDNLSSCAGAIADFFGPRNGSDLDRNPDFDDWADVAAVRNAFADDVADLHRRLIDASPFTFEDGGLYGVTVTRADVNDPRVRGQLTIR